jgi:hypothetical protein
VTRGSPLVEQLRALHRDAAAVIETSSAAHAAALGKLSQLDLDIRHWETQLDDRPEVPLLTAARRELGFALYSASSGLYVQAFGSLRLFLELGFASVFFSANELLRRKWLADRADFSWSKALDENEGVLARGFVQEFSPSAAADASMYAERAAECYRYCSQFVHGKFAYTAPLPDALVYADEPMRKWLEVAEDAAKCVLYLIYARYGDDLLPTQMTGPLPGTLDWFGHLPAVRERLGLPVERGT